MGSRALYEGTVALEVEDFDAAVARLKADGVPSAFEPMESPVCRMAVISDPDGNSLLIHKRKEQAEQAA